MKIQTRVAGFLLFHENLDFCDACLATRLVSTPAEVRAAVTALRARAPIFLRDRWTCQICGKQAEVTRALAGPTIAMKSAIRRRASRVA